MVKCRKVAYQKIADFYVKWLCVFISSVGKLSSLNDLYGNKHYHTSTHIYLLTPKIMHFIIFFTHDPDYTYTIDTPAWFGIWIK